MNKELQEKIASLETELGDLLIKIETWYKLLCCCGVNSKKIVREEIKKVLEENNMIKNLSDAIKYAKGKNINVCGQMENSRVIKVNGKRITLPLTIEEFKKEVGI